MKQESWNGTELKFLHVVYSKWPKCKTGIFLSWICPLKLRNSLADHPPKVIITDDWADANPFHLGGQQESCRKQRGICQMLAILCQMIGHWQTECIIIDQQSSAFEAADSLWPMDVHIPLDYKWPHNDPKYAQSLELLVMLSWTWSCAFSTYIVGMMAEWGMSGQHAKMAICSLGIALGH